MPALSRSRPLLSPLALGAVLLLAAPLAMAQNVRVAPGPGEGGERPGSEATAEDETRSEASANQRRARATGNRSDEGNNARVPRWHSFLPGMFR